MLIKVPAMVLYRVNITCTIVKESREYHKRFHQERMNFFILELNEKNIYVNLSVLHHLQQDRHNTHLTPMATKHDKNSVKMSITISAT